MGISGGRGSAEAAPVPKRLWTCECAGMQEFMSFARMMCCCCPPPLAMQTGVYSLSIPSETARNLSRKLMQGQTDPRTSDLQSVSPWSGPGI